MPELGSTNLLGLILASAAVGLIPFLTITTTAFLKLAVVLLLVRNALGTQQAPPTLVLYAVALVLTAYVSAPMLSDIYDRLSAPGLDLSTANGLRAAATSVAEPLRAHLERFAKPEEREFLLDAARQVWPANFAAKTGSNDLLILIPAFVMSELTRAFEAGFLLYLPFIAVDLIVSNVLMAMGMAMVSPLVISVPFKLLLFVLVNGWTRLLHGLVLGYS